MVLTVKPLPNDSDSTKQGKGHDLQPKTVVNAGYFWDNYCKFCPIFEGESTFILRQMDLY